MYRLQLFFVGLVVLCSSCWELDKVVDPYDPVLQTTDASKLFFKNTRQIFYEREVLPGNGMELYRHNKWQQDSTKPLLRVTLVNNWKYDEAYVFLEPNPAFPGRMDSLVVIWKNPEKDTKGRFTLEEPNAEARFTFASLIHRGMGRGYKFFVELEGKEIPILTEPDNRKAFKDTMRDYYRLLNLDG